MASVMFHLLYLKGKSLWYPLGRGWVGSVHPADSLFTILVTDQFNFVFSPLILGHVCRVSEGGCWLSFVCPSIWYNLAFTGWTFVKFYTLDLHESRLRKLKFFKIGQNQHVFMTSFVISITIVANIAVGFWLSRLLSSQVFCGYVKALQQWAFSISLHHTVMFFLSQVRFSTFYSVLDRVSGAESESAL
jgi:hypothetical protein